MAFSVRNSVISVGGSESAISADSVTVVSVVITLDDVTVVVLSFFVVEITVVAVTLLVIISSRYASAF